MLYLELSEIYEKLGSTTKRLEKTYYISELLKKTDKESLPEIMLLLQGRVFPPWDQREIGVASKLVLKAINLATGIEMKNVENEWKKTGDLGIVAEHFVKKKHQATLFSEQLTVKKVFFTLRKVAGFEGPGTIDKKIKLITELLTSAKPIEARYIVRTVLEEMRVGVGSGSVRDAIVWAYLPKVYGVFFKCQSCNSWMPNTPKCLACGADIANKFNIKEAKQIEGSATLKAYSLTDVKSADLSNYGVIIPENERIARDVYNYFVECVQSAYDVSNDFSIVALTLLEKGLSGLLSMGVEPGRPIKVMLAQKVRDIKEGLERVGVPAEVEYKYDGFRMQIHKKGDEITLFTRRLENVTKQFPEVVGYVKSHVDGNSYILDSEAVGYDRKTGRYMPFQHISQRIKRKYHIDKLSDELPVELNVFDIMYYNGETLINKPFRERRKLLERIITPAERQIVLAKNLVTKSEEEVKKFYKESLDAGNEGIMLKKLDAVYKPGSRVGYMVKLKPTMETLDVVIVGAEWGEGKRANWLTSFTIAVLDDDGNLVEVGKVGTGIKELEGEGITFAQLTETLKPLILSEKGKSVRVKPEVVIEVTYEEIQKSPTYSSGYALRFPRLVKVRDDRGLEDCSTLGMVEQLYLSQRR